MDRPPPSPISTSPDSFNKMRLKRGANVISSYRWWEKAGRTLGRRARRGNLRLIGSGTVADIPERPCRG
jgi:hypothetical protein